MRSLLQKTRTPYGAIIAASCLLILILGLAMATRAQASSPEASAGKRLITIHDDGQDKGILTRATTLREALQEAKINLDASDTVEPGLDEELVGNNYEANIYRARPVTIVDGAIRTKVMSPYRTAAQIVEQAGMTLQDEDTTEINANTNILTEGSGVKLTIDRAAPFTLVLYGKQTQDFTQAKTVGEMLTEKKITLAAEDTLSVASSTPITSGMIVELWRNGKQTQTVEEAIPFETEKVQDSAREVGYKEVKTTGENGKKTVTYEIVMKNGKEEGRQIIQSVETQQAIKQVEIAGTKMTNSFNGSFAEALARLQSCEGSYTSNTGNGYYGAYQFDKQTWGGYGGYAVASDAPPAVQDEKAWLTYQRRGWQPWPSCSKKMGLQDIYR